jgi:hypothetical protein
MAFTVSMLAKTVFGDERVQHYKVTADAASGTVDTGLGVLTNLHWSPASCATGAFVVRMNANAAGTASNGTVGVSCAASGDGFYLTVYGR